MTRFKPGDGPFKFRIELEGRTGMETAALRPPFDVPAIFGTKARVPVRGTINGFPFRSSLCNMGDGHCMVVNKELRSGGRCKAGDIVEIVLERDRAERVVDLPKDLRAIVAKNKKTQAGWDQLSFTHKKEWLKAIQEAKRPETRDSRIGKLLAVLEVGKKVGI